MSSDHGNLKKRYLVLLRERETLHTTCHELEEQRDRALAATGKLEAAVTELDQENSELEKEVKALRLENKTMRLALTKREDTDKGQSESKTKKQQELEEVNAQLQKTVKELRASATEAEEQAYIMSRNMTRANDRIDDLKEALERAKEKYVQLKNEAREAAQEAYERQRDTEREYHIRIKEARAANRRTSHDDDI